jgi:tetratricopeptide (TPR) repeat protein
MALELDPTNPTILADIGQLHYFARENDLSMEYINKALELDPDNAQAQSYLSMVTSQAVIGDKEATLGQLTKSALENAFTLPYINVDPRYDGLRDDPRFQKILHSMGLGE